MRTMPHETQILLPRGVNPEIATSSFSARTRSTTTFEGVPEARDRHLATSAPQGLPGSAALDTRPVGFVVTPMSRAMPSVNLL